MSAPIRFKIPVGIFIIPRRRLRVLLQLRPNYSFSGHWGNAGIPFYEDRFSGDNL